MDKPKGLGKPAPCERGAKIGVYGEAGTGKTELLMSAVNYGKLYVMDCEGRTQYYDPEEGHGFEVLYSHNVADAIELLQYVEGLHAQGEKVVFAIDDFSAVWDEQKEVAEKIGSTSRGTAKYSSWGPAKKPLKQFYKMLLATPVDVIITMRSKPAYSDDATAPEELGYNKPVIERGLPYMDLVVEMNTDDLDPGTPLAGENFWALVTKTSGPKEGNPLPIGTTIRNPTFAKLVGLRLKGTNKLDIADGDVDLQVLQAITNTVEDLKGLIADLGLSEEGVFARLKERYGEYDRKRMPEYVAEVVKLHDNHDSGGIGTVTEPVFSQPEQVVEVEQVEDEPEDGDVNLSELQETITTGTELKALIADLGLDEEEVLAGLREKYGEYTSDDLPKYVAEVVEIHGNGAQ